jgi:hypothetical protein
LNNGMEGHLINLVAAQLPGDPSNVQASSVNGQDTGPDLGGSANFVTVNYRRPSMTSCGRLSRRGGIGLDTRADSSGVPTGGTFVRGGSHHVHLRRAPSRRAPGSSTGDADGRADRWWPRRREPPQAPCRPSRGHIQREGQGNLAVPVAARCEWMATTLARSRRRPASFPLSLCNSTRSPAKWPSTS